MGQRVVGVVDVSIPKLNTINQKGCSNLELLELFIIKGLLKNA